MLSNVSSTNLPGQKNLSHPIVLIYEPHAPGHGHFRYSSSLILALNSLPDSHYSVEMLASRHRNYHETYGFVCHAAIDPVRPLAEYTWRIACPIHRVLHWGSRDRQIRAFVRQRRLLAGLHYQEAYGLSTLHTVRRMRAEGVRSILTVHNVRPHQLRRWEPKYLRVSVDRALYRSFDALIVHSERLNAELREFIGPKGPKQFIVPHGIETAVPSPRPLNERMGQKHLLFVGAPRPNKGLSVLLQSLRQLPDYSLTLAGYHSVDRYRTNVVDPMIAAAQQQGCRIQIYPGYLSDIEMDSLMRTHSATVLPYLNFSAQSGVLSQAIQYRLPVVATDVGALGETVRAYGIGAVVRPGDVEELAAGVRRLEHMDPTELAVGLDAAAQACSWKNAAEATAAIYDDVFHPTTTFQS